MGVVSMNAFFFTLRMIQKSISLSILCIDNKITKAKGKYLYRHK